MKEEVIREAIQQIKTLATISDMKSRKPAYDMQAAAYQDGMTDGLERAVEVIEQLLTR